jgi:hypothetical protein
MEPPMTLADEAQFIALWQQRRLMLVPDEDDG